ncbi:MAG: hypothetical protein ACKE51_06170 [Methylococcaceae bacterium]
MVKIFRWVCLFFFVCTLTGCFDWIRVYQTYRQMHEFDQHFAITVTDEFSLSFKHPILYSDDFISLSKLQPSTIVALQSGERWRYWFRKVDESGQVIKPEIKFYFDLNFNKEKRLTRWAFSSLFLQIAPAEFLEISVRSIGTAEINTEKRQMRANMDLIEKLTTELPLKQQVLKKLGEPIAIKTKKRKNQEVYRYHFQLETHDIKEGYEDRALSVVKLTFDKHSDKLIKMAGRFVGLKVSIDYRKYLIDKAPHLAKVIEK